MKKKFIGIDDILASSDKAELIEKLGEVLEIEGSKVVIITGVPNTENGGLDMVIHQTGHKYLYEVSGFIQEADYILGKDLKDEA